MKKRPLVFWEYFPSQAAYRPLNGEYLNFPNRSLNSPFSYFLKEKEKQKKKPSGP